jgi:hypothetical protein
MTIPTQVLDFARALDKLMADGAELARQAHASSEQASGAEALGHFALATELDQLAKVYRNYMPRIYKHVGELDASIFDDFISREAQDGEDRSATIARLQLELEVLVNRSYSGPLPDADQERMSVLTANLRLGG